VKNGTPYGTPEIEEKVFGINFNRKGYKKKKALFQ